MKSSCHREEKSERACLLVKSVIFVARRWIECSAKPGRASHRQAFCSRPIAESAAMLLSASLDAVERGIQTSGNSQLVYTL
jgi:hypothetical protein